MPNKPRPENPGRVIRFEDDLWNAVKRLAERRAVTPSQIVRTAVAQYVKRGSKNDALATALGELAADLHAQGWSQGPKYAARLRAVLADYSAQRRE